MLMLNFRCTYILHSSCMYMYYVLFVAVLQVHERFSKRTYLRGDIYCIAIVKRQQGVYIGNSNVINFCPSMHVRYSLRLFTNKGTVES